MIRPKKVIFIGGSKYDPPQKIILCSSGKTMSWMHGPHIRCKALMSHTHRMKSWTDHEPVELLVYWCDQ